MKFDITRQPLAPAIITLFVVTVMAMCNVGGTGGVLTPAEVDCNPMVAKSLTGMAVPTIGTLIGCFQASYPLWSRLIAGLMIFFTGMCIGRMTIRYNLYGVNTRLAIPLYGIIACGISMGADYLVGFIAATTLALAVKNLARSFCNGYGFDGVFRAGLYLGLTTLVEPITLPLLLLMPLGLLLFRRTSREAVVGLVGLVLAPLTLCYVNWGAGGDFFAPILPNMATFISNAPLGLFASISLSRLALLGAILALDLLAVFFFFADHHSVGTKPRLILSFQVGVFLFTAILLYASSATANAIALLAVPSAVLLPIFFVRLRWMFSSALYLLLIILASYLILQ